MILEIKFNIKAYTVFLRINSGPVRVIIEPGEMMFFEQTLEKAYLKLLQVLGDR